MKTLKLTLFLIFGIFFASARGAELTVQGKVTALKVYETTDGSTNVWIVINGQGRIGPNPANSGIQCEAWTNSKSVHATALAAMMSGKKVDVIYVDNSNGNAWCKVRVLVAYNE